MAEKSSGPRGSSGGNGSRTFRERVERIVKAIPKGQVLSYGQVALLAGRPGGARAVVRALYQISGAPWWRVIRSDGTVAQEMAARQVPRLRADGMKIRGRRLLGRRGVRKNS